MTRTLANTMSSDSVVFVGSMARFKPGDRVRVLPTVTSPFVGLDGVIDEVKPHPRNLTQLDSYTVRFNWGEKQTFWDAQLEPADVSHAPGSKIV